MQSQHCTASALTRILICLYVCMSVWLDVCRLLALHWPLVQNQSIALFCFSESDAVDRGRVSPVESCIASCGTEDRIHQWRWRTGTNTGAGDRQSEEAPGKNLQTRESETNQKNTLRASANALSTLNKHSSSNVKRTFVQSYLLFNNVLKISLIMFSYLYIVHV